MTMIMRRSIEILGLSACFSMCNLEAEFCRGGCPNRWRCFQVVVNIESMLNAASGTAHHMACAIKMQSVDGETLTLHGDLVEG